MEQALNKNRKILCNYNDDFNGNMVDTFCVELQGKGAFDYNRGAVAMGKFFYPHTIQSNVTALGLVDSYLFSNAGSTAGGYIWYANIQSGPILSSGNIANTHFTQLNSTAAPTITNGDMAVFGNTSGADRMIVPSATNLHLLLNGTWTTNWWTSTLSQGNLSSNVHPLAVFRQPFLLLVPDGNLLHTVDQVGNVINSRLALPYNHIIKWCKVTESKIYLGVSDTNNGSAGVYEYDPVNETAYFTPLDTLASNPGIPIIDSGTLIVLAADGRLKKFSGGVFTIVEETPYSKRINSPNFLNFHRNAGFVANNCYYFLLPDSSNAVVGAWAGLYCYDKSTGNFYHTKTITYGSTFIDSGQMLVNSAGAIFSDGTHILVSITDFASANAAQTGIYMDSDAFSSGSGGQRATFTTPKILAASIKDTWSNAWLKYYLSGSDQIVPKVRNSRVNALIPSGGPSQGTWTGQNTFTAGISLSTALVGSEIMILYGYGAGLTSTITGINGTAVTIADNLGSNTKLMFYIVTNFQPMSAISTTANQSNFASVIDSLNTNEWIQLKIELQGTSPVVEDLLLDRAVHTEIT